MPGPSSSTIRTTEPLRLAVRLLIADSRRLGAVLDGELVPAGQRNGAKLVREDFRQGREVDLLLLDGQTAGVESREVEQVGGQLRQACDLLAHRRHELPLRRCVEILVGHELEEAAEREERRTELVGGVRDELTSGVLELRQAL